MNSLLPLLDAGWHVRDLYFAHAIFLAYTGAKLFLLLSNKWQVNGH